MENGGRRLEAVGALADTYGMDNLWEEWERLTRFLESSRVVFARERGMWESLNLADFDGARIRTKLDQVEYDVDLDDHIETLEDGDILWGAVLVHSYALAQSAIGDHVDIDLRCASGIESWAGRFLKANGKTWSAVKGGEGGAIEVAVMRNAVAHGERTISKAASKRLKGAGSKFERAPGTKIKLSYPHLRGYRLRLESLLKAGGL